MTSQPDHVKIISQNHHVKLNEMLKLLLESSFNLYLVLLLRLKTELLLGDMQEIIAKTRAVSRTIKLLSSTSPDERHAAISFLLELSNSELQLENIGSTAGSILILITMKFNNSDDPVTSEKAGEVLQNL